MTVDGVLIQYKGINMRILQLGRLSNDVNEALASGYDTTFLWQQTQADEYLRQNGNRFDLVVTSAQFGLTQTQLEYLPNLKAVCSFGVGYDAINVADLQKRGIVLSNTPDVLTDCVADLAWGLILDVARRISAADRYVRSLSWGGKQRFGNSTRVSGKRLGILGLGRIGKAIAKRGEGFGMDIAYHNRQKVADVAYAYFDDLGELATWADFLVIACPGGKETQGLVDASVLKALGEHGFLINIARGSIVDEAALIEVLQAKQLAGAALDVYVQEPNIPTALLQNGTVVLTPHMGSATLETRQDMDALLLDNVASFMSTGRLLTAVALKP